MANQLLNRFNAPGPKRILALDGGGIRGALTLGYLEEIEAVLKKQNGNKESFRLSDYFDLIGGTSTGSIIAGCLAMGWKVADIRDKYFELGGKIFGQKNKWYNIFKPGAFAKASYDSGPLEENLELVFGDIRLDNVDTIKTGLCIVAKRADTNSVWPLINHPGGKYFNSKEGTNGKILLRDAIRASAAAPSYFLPQMIDVGGGMRTAAFVDGGVSMANNPALQLLMVATLKGFPFHWPMGENNILLVSVGTGMSKWNKIPADVKKNHLLNWASELPDMFMQDGSWHNQLMLQWMSNCLTPWEIDGETGDLSTDFMSTPESPKHLLTYTRYNTWLEKATLDALTGKSFSETEVKELVKMDEADTRFDLNKIGLAAAQKGAVVHGKVTAMKVEEAHFPRIFSI